MASKLMDYALEAIGGSPIMKGRTKITTDEIIRNYPSGVTVTACDIIPGENGDYAIFNFKEDPDKFFSGGAMATKVVKTWLEKSSGSISAVNADLVACGGLKFRLYKTTTKKGRTMTAFDPVQEQ